MRVFTQGDRAAVLSFLSQAPYDNVFLAWVVSDPSVARSSLYVYRGAENAVRGVAFFGRQVVLACESDEVTDAFAACAPLNRRERMIVAPRPMVERYWERIRDRHAPPRVVRESQPVFALGTSPQRSEPPSGVRVRRALPGEWEIVAHNSAKMIEHELEYDPRGFSADFNANVRMMIERGLWWVAESSGKLCFFCNAGPRSEHALQLQGIWTPPEMRGKGLATDGLAQICEQLLREVPALCLYVNAFNARAMALYERVGFAQTGEFATLLF